MSSFDIYHSPSFDQCRILPDKALNSTEGREVGTRAAALSSFVVENSNLEGRNEGVSN